MSEPLLAAFGESDPGLLREKNEDTFYVDCRRGIFGVIDGMGGHAAGEEAARIACEVIVATLLNSEGDAEWRLREAITSANNTILQTAKEKPAWDSMACVLTFALIEGTDVTIGHVGDTRGYRLRGAAIERLTQDHSVVGELEERCIVTELEAMQHPSRNEVLRDVGSEKREPCDADFIDIYRSELREGDGLLLCTDG